MSPPKSSSPASGAEGQSADEVETITEEDPSNGQVVRALYVTGPRGGVRHVLPLGVVSIGRGAEATIVVPDPRVSRAHAMLHVGASMELADLDSANGTFLGEERVRQGNPRPLAHGQTFFVGDSALVVRPHSLKRSSPGRLSSLHDVRRRLNTTQSAPSVTVVLKVRSLKKQQRWITEAILAEKLAPERDFMFRLDDDELLLGIRVGSESEVGRLERSVLEALVGWSVPAEVRAKVVTADDVERAGENLLPLLTSDAPTTLVRGKMIVRDPAMRALQQSLSRVAPTTVNVLVLGETGAGKDVIAILLHELSGRAEHPFVGLNCASLPESLLESELFGYERGAFTGATVTKPGLLEAAEGGTLFLDEVGDLPLSLQAKLLRVIETREVTRLGGLKPRSIDVRIVAATNHNLGRDVGDGRFRQDLFYRLNSVTLTVPPLRERPTEIEPLARFFLENACNRFDTGEVRLSDAAVSVLVAHSWPGNVRELKNVLERAVLLTQTRLIEPVDLGLPQEGERSVPPRKSTTESGGAASTGDLDPNDERERIVRALEECGGNQSRAAQKLGLSRRTLVRKIAQLGLPRPREKGS